MRGLASLGALRESDKGPAAAAEGAARGLLFGKALQLVPILSTTGRASTLAALGAADSVGHGGNANDVLSSALTMGVLGTLGGPRKMTDAEVQIEELQKLLTEHRFAEAEYAIKKGATEYLLPGMYPRWLIGFNKKVGAANERLGRQTDVADGYSVGDAPRYYVGRRRWRQGDWTRRNESGDPIEIMDAKRGRLSPDQLRKDKKAPLPTTYLPRDEIVRRAKELLKKNRRR